MVAAVSRTLLAQRGILSCLLPAARASAAGAAYLGTCSSHQGHASVPGSHSFKQNTGSKTSYWLATSSVLAGAAAAAAVAVSNDAHPAQSEAPTANCTPHDDQETVLYQYAVCPFCCKVKAVMDYYKVPYRTVEVAPLSQKELKWSEYKKVPVLVMGGVQYNDSSVIGEMLKTKFDPPAKMENSWLDRLLKSGKTEDESAALAEEKKWRKWVDEWFVRVVTTNIYRSWGESVGSFDYVMKNVNFGPVERMASKYAGAVAMYFVAKNMKKKYNIEGDDRAHLYHALDEWVEAVGDRQFMGGDKPDLSDLYVFGVLRAVQGTETFKDAMSNTSIQSWFVRMTGAVGEPSIIAG